MGKANNKIIASIVTVAVLALLVFAGPAQAYSLNLEFENTEAEQGKKIEPTATVDVESGEALDIDEIVLILDPVGDRETVECSFDVTGKMKSGVNEPCHGINIKKIKKKKIQGYGYNYGYGYGYGVTNDLVYDITIHTQKFDVGEYDTQLKIIVDGSEVVQDGETITITPKQKGKEHQEKNQEQETKSEDEEKGENKNQQHESNGNVNGKGWLAETQDDDEPETEDEEIEEKHGEKEEKNNNSSGESGNSGENGNSANSGSSSPQPSGNSNSGGNGNSGSSDSSGPNNAGNSNSGGKGKGKNK